MRYVPDIYFHATRHIKKCTHTCNTRCGINFFFRFVRNPSATLKFNLYLSIHPFIHQIARKRIVRRNKTMLLERCINF